MKMAPKQFKLEVAYNSKTTLNPNFTHITMSFKKKHFFTKLGENAIRETIIKSVFFFYKKIFEYIKYY